MSPPTPILTVVPDPPESPGPAGRAAAQVASGHGPAAAVFAAVLVLGLAAFQLWFAVSCFKDRSQLTSDQPVLNVDWCSQYYWSYAARAFNEYHGRLWGYDPHFMAGYPLDFVFNSSLPVQLAATTLPTANLARVIKGVFLAGFVLVPFCFYFPLRWFELPRGPALAATVLAVVYFQISESALFGVWGMIAGAFILSFFLVPLGLFYRLLRRPETSPLLLLIGALALALTIHKTAVVLVFPICLIWMVLFFPHLKPSYLGLLITVFAVAVLINLYWLLPFFKFLPLKIEDPATTFFQNTDQFRLFKDLWPLPPHPHFGVPLARLAIMGAGAAGLIHLRRRQAPLYFPLVAALVFMGLFAYFGSYIPFFRHLQPYRYVTAYFNLWLPAAGIGLVSIYQWARVRKPGRITGPALLGGFALFLLLLLVLPSYRSFSRLAPLSTDFDGPTRELVGWLRKNTDRSARVLFEDVNEWSEGGPAVYNGAKLASLMPVLVDREYIGGPLPNAFILHHYAGFEDGRLFGRPIGEISSAELRELLDLYNIKWAVSWSDAAQAVLGAYPGAALAADFGYIKVFTFERTPNYFLRGSGRVSADFDQLTLSGLVTDSGMVVISYHWSPGLVSVPPARLHRMMLGDDPAGFIAVEDPPSGLVIGLGPAISR